ncbi:cathepsin L-like peptidase [Parasteatoda tepidariorum]|uniref:cathepsin L-like peptidase n=1 Tax=Parasteatoda tepidariorum TaxID=114398 RepID=UPI00077FA9EC|nr:procathepsin L [Parasteatoda tepidariorum]
MKLIILFLMFAAAACGPTVYSPFDSELNEFWEAFKLIFNKSYNLKEELSRRLIWEQKIADIVRHNLHADLGIHSYRRGINKLTDLKPEEYKRLNGYRGQSNSIGNATTWLSPMNVNIPESIDWRAKGYVTEVKDQKQCGSCWAFSTTGSLEGQHFKKTGKLVSLSEQNLVDCSHDEGNYGCNGGWMDQGFQYVKVNHGIDTEKSYPYEAAEKNCHFRKRDIGATCTGYVDLPEGDEEALKKAVATVGPISVAINSAGDFGSYSSGVYDVTFCPNTIADLTHGVLVVGYGTEGGKDYWLVKNSWGPSWGENGYIKMARNKNNQCGIATKASYPLV